MGQKQPTRQSGLCEPARRLSARLSPRPHTLCPARRHQGRRSADSRPSSAECVTCRRGLQPPLPIHASLQHILPKTSFLKIPRRFSLAAAPNPPLRRRPRPSAPSRCAECRDADELANSALTWFDDLPAGPVPLIYSSISRPSSVWSKRGWASSSQPSFSRTRSVVSQKDSLSEALPASLPPAVKPRALS